MNVSPWQTVQLALSDPSWGERALVKFFDKWVSTYHYLNNKVVLLDSDQQTQLLDCQFFPVYGTVTTNLLSPQPPAPQSDTRSYLSPQIPRGFHPDSCTSATLVFAGTVVLTVALIATAETGIGLAAAVGSIMVMAGAGLDMNSQCGH